MPVLLNQGKKDIRNAIKGIVTHLAVSDDQAAFVATQTSVSPTGGSTTIIKVPVIVDTTVTSPDDAFTATITLDSAIDLSFVGKSIWSIGLCKANAVTAAISRFVRTLGIGFQDGDVQTITVRMQVQDNNA